MEPDLSAAIYPTLIFNGNAGSDSTWRHIPTITVPPAGAPKNAIMLKRDGLLSESPLKSALLHGVFLTREQVVKCLAAERIQFPDKGSGANGRILKIDLVRKLLSEVLGDTVSEEQQKRLARNLAKEAAPEELPTDMDDGSCPEEVLHLLATMDADNKDSFQKILEQATAILEERKRKNATRSAAKPKDEPAGAKPAGSEVKPDDAADKRDDAAVPAPDADGPPGDAHADKHDDDAPPALDASGPPGDDAHAARVVAAGDAPEVLPARPHIGSDASRPRTQRKLTPDSLKSLLPPLSDDKVYLTWKSKTSQIQVEFLGSLPGTSKLCLVHLPCIAQIRSKSQTP